MAFVNCSSDFDNLLRFSYDKMLQTSDFFQETVTFMGKKLLLKCNNFEAKTHFTQNAAVAAADEIKAQVISFLLQLAEECSVNNLDVINNTLQLTTTPTPPRHINLRGRLMSFYPCTRQLFIAGNCNCTKLQPARNHIKIMYYNYKE